MAVRHGSDARRPLTGHQPCFSTVCVPLLLYHRFLLAALTRAPLRWDEGCAPAVMVLR